MGSRVISAALTLQDRDFSSNLRRAARRTDDLGRGVTAVGNKIKAFSDGATRSISNVASSLKTISFTALGAGVAGLTAAVGSSVLEMDSAFDRIEARTGITGSKLTELQGAAKEVFKSGFGESLSSVADDVSMLATMFENLSGNEIAEVAKGASTISQLWGAETLEIGRAVQGLVNNFDDVTETKALDLMTFAFQKTGDYAGDLLDTFNEYSVQFSSLGFSAEEFTGMLISGAKAGAFNIDKVGDAVKEFSLRAIDGSNTTIAGFEAIGLNADEMAQKIAAGGESSKTAFAATLAGLAAIEDPVERNTAGVNLFGTQWEDVRENVIMAMADGANAVEGFEGSTAKAADAMQDNFKTKITQAWRDLQVTLADLANSKGAQELLNSIATKAQEMVPVIKDIAQKAIDFANSIRDNWGPIKETIISIGSAVATFAVGMGALSIINTVTTFVKGFRAALAAGTVAQWAMNLAMLANPATLVVAGFAALVAIGVVLYRNWDTVKEKASALWAKFKESPAGGWLKNQFDRLASAVSTVKSFFSSLKKTATELFNKLTSFKMPSWVTTIGSTLSSAKEKVGGIISKAKNALPSFDVGTNNVSHDMVANIHKGEMIIPARQAENLRRAGYNINNIDSQKTSPTSSISPSTSSRGGNNITIHINGADRSNNQIVDDLVTKLKLAMENI